ncbi:hypothetical protein Q4488_13080 [Amphritea sp. 1_MG-2023]|uniref:hypothetical protein n=1 Tax=Amphritea sp. 1_MG-2023 TaxID=3062670 RepID=UPI0026E2AB49|nr:hypothetical protein [Amphritea sp. 1_MG-2023]MDO6564322.1 hypothetical protein [Amphritea sp. 1_MG-2023]
MMLLLIVLIVVIGLGVWGWPLLVGVIGLTRVTDKAEALQQIKQLMQTYEISLAEVETAYHIPAGLSAKTDVRGKSEIVRTLFAYLGGVFIVAGVSVYINLFWDDMGSVMRVIVTLGVGYILLIALLKVLHDEQHSRFVVPLTMACMIMMTGGWFVLVDEYLSQGHNWRLAVLSVFAMMALHQAILWAKYRRTVFVFCGLFFVYGALETGLELSGVPVYLRAIILGSSLFLVAESLAKTAYRVLSSTALLVAIIWLNSGLFERIAMSTSANWASVIVGVGLMLTAFGMQKAGRYLRLQALGYVCGSVMAYGGLFDLLQHTAMETLFFALTAVILYVCVQLQSRALLLTTVIAMLGFIAYFSEKYFAHSLGWPATLVLIGIAFLAVGTLALKLKQRF